MILDKLRDKVNYWLGQRSLQPTKDQSWQMNPLGWGSLGIVAFAASTIFWLMLKANRPRHDESADAQAPSHGPGSDGA
jgi:hypothetical protein